MRPHKFHYKSKRNIDQKNSGSIYSDNSIGMLISSSYIDNTIQDQSISESNIPSMTIFDTMEASTVEVYLDKQLRYSDSAFKFAKQFTEKPLKVIKVLAEVIQSLKKTQDYNSLYVSYLLNQLSEEDFMKEADSFSYEPALKLDHDVLEKIEILYKFVNEKFSTSDISDIFHIDIEVAEKALEEISAKIGIE